MTQTPPPPVISPDGRFWWDGTAWQPLPVAAAVAATSYELPRPPGSLPEEPERHDGLAIASLVLALLWGFGVGSIAAVVLGHLSRGKAKREGRPPSGVALAGLLVGYVSLAMSAVLFLAVFAVGTSVRGDFHQQQIHFGTDPHTVQVP